MAKIPETLPPFAKKEVIKKLKAGSDNYKVYLYLAHGNSLTVAEARAGEFPLTQDLRSRISDLENKYKVQISSMRVLKDGVLRSYKRYWIQGSIPELDRLVSLEDSALSSRLEEAS